MKLIASAYDPRIHTRISIYQINAGGWRCKWQRDFGDLVSLIDYFSLRERELLDNVIKQLPDLSSLISDEEEEGDVQQD